MADDLETVSRARVGGVLDDKWTMERLLGVGGMAAVYAARHRNGARAAVKVLHPHLCRHPEVRERFLREGYAANRVEHPGAVKVLDDDVISSGPDAGTAYLVMELLEGVSLQERLDRGPPIGELEFLRIAGDVLDVLQAAHARGVIHRDLKPENLFLVELHEKPAIAGQTRIKVLDFGLARILQAQAITSFGLALGTPSFMSPEQATGQSDQVDGRTDLFALAATGFRIRTGRRIHEGGNAVELVQKMGSLAAPRLRTLATDASEPFARVIDRALEFRREDRYESAAAMQRDVQRAIDEVDTGAAATLFAVPAPTLPPATPPREPTTIALALHPASPDTRRRKGASFPAGMVEGSGIAPFDVPGEQGCESGGERAKRVEPERSAQGDLGFLRGRERAIPKAPAVRRRVRLLLCVAAALLLATGAKLTPFVLASVGSLRFAGPGSLRLGDAGTCSWASAAVVREVVADAPREVWPENSDGPQDAPAGSDAAVSKAATAPVVLLKTPRVASPKAGGGSVRKLPSKRR